MKHNDLLSKKHEKACRSLNDFNFFLFSLFLLVVVFLRSALASLAGVPRDIGSSAVGLRNCALTAGLKTY